MQNFPAFYTTVSLFIFPRRNVFIHEEALTELKNRQWLKKTCEKHILALYCHSVRPFLPIQLLKEDLASIKQKSKDFMSATVEGTTKKM